MGIGKGNGPGGRRAGAGRPQGAKNKRRPAAAHAVNAGQQLPLDYMLEVMNDPRQPLERRDRMAVAAAPYLHARLNAKVIHVFDPMKMTDEELEAAIESVDKLISGDFGSASPTIRGAR